MKIVEKWFDSVAIFLGSNEPMWLKVLWGIFACLALSSLFIVIWMPLTFGKSPPALPPPTQKAETTSKTLSRVEKQSTEDASHCSESTQCKKRVSVKYIETQTIKTETTTLAYSSEYDNHKQ